MPSPLLSALAALLALLPAGAQAQSWGQEKSPLTATPQYAASKALCRKLEDGEPPAADRPTAAQSKALRGCDAEALYYGEGRKPDYAKARICAFGEADAADDEVFGGSTILMQLYANGLGVKRNLDVAIGYACRIEGAPAEIDGRLNHLAALRAKPGAKRFDYCDDITSGLAEGFCASRGAQKAKDARGAKLSVLEAKIAPQARAAYQALKKTSDAFIDAHGGNEVDLSGTARAAMEIEEEEASRDRFLKHLRTLLTGQWPAATPTAAADADKALNAAYRKALAFLPTKDNFSTVKAEEVKTTQRAWIAYRDAFVRFAKAAAPGVRPEAVAAALTQERTGQLTELVG